MDLWDRILLELPTVSVYCRPQVINVSRGKRVLCFRSATDTLKLWLDLSDLVESGTLPCCHMLNNEAGGRGNLMDADYYCHIVAILDNKFLK